MISDFVPKVFLLWSMFRCFSLNIGFRIGLDCRFGSRPKLIFGALSMFYKIFALRFRVWDFVRELFQTYSFGVFCRQFVSILGFIFFDIWLLGPHQDLLRLCSILIPSSSSKFYPRYFFIAFICWYRFKVPAYSLHLLVFSIECAFNQCQESSYPLIGRAFNEVLFCIGGAGAPACKLISSNFSLLVTDKLMPNEDAPHDGRGWYIFSYFRGQVRLWPNKRH